MTEEENLILSPGELNPEAIPHILLGDNLNPGTELLELIGDKPG
jgi:hypothetical protein